MKRSCVGCAVVVLFGAPAWGAPAQTPATPAPAPVPPPAAPTALEPIPEAPKGDALLQADIERLVERLMAVQSLESFEARDELLEIGRPAVDALLKAVKDKRPEMRHLACELLGEIRDPKAIPVLAEALGDKDEFGTSVASVAARALGRIGDRSAIQTLLKVLESPDRDLRYESARALGVLRANEAAATLRKLLTDEGETAHRRLVRCAAAESLGRLRDRDALEDLSALLTVEAQERQTERRVKVYAALAFERITGLNKGNLRGGEKERDEAVKAWDAWWKRRSAKAPEAPPAAAPPAGGAAVPAAPPAAPKPEEKKP